MSSQPWQSTMNVRPKGMPKPAKTKLLTPVDEPQRPPTWQDIMTPKESSRPLRRSTVGETHRGDDAVDAGTIEGEVFHEDAAR